MTEHTHGGPYHEPGAGNPDMSTHSRHAHHPRRANTGEGPATYQQPTSARPADREHLLQPSKLGGLYLMSNARETRNPALGLLLLTHYRLTLSGQDQRTYATMQGQPPQHALTTPVRPNPPRLRKAHQRTTHVLSQPPPCRSFTGPESKDGTLSTTTGPTRPTPPTPRRNRQSRHRHQTTS